MTASSRVRLGPNLIDQSRIGKQVQQQVRDHPLGGLDTAEQQNRGVGEHLVRRQRAGRVGHLAKKPVPGSGGLQHGPAQRGIGHPSGIGKGGPGRDLGDRRHDVAVPRQQLGDRDVLQPKSHLHTGGGQWRRQLGAQFRGPGRS